MKPSDKDAYEGEFVIAVVNIVSKVHVPIA
jgi:hypothetical protein